MLLILAGVSIATLTGNNGILTRANDAKEQTEEAKEEELRGLTALEAATNLEDKEYIDSNGDKAIIPAGFAISQVEGENTIEDGLVIIDKNENEFVWIPVNNVDNFKTYEGYAYGVLQENTLSNCEEPYVSDIEEYNEMKASIEKNKGFYVARYEAGNENGNVVSKKGKKVWNNVPWGDSMTDAGTSGSVFLARNMYYDNYGIKSTLIYGVE